MLRAFFRYTCGCLMIIAGFYGVIALCLGIFIVMGRVTPGEPMSPDFIAPTAIESFAFAAGSLVVTFFCARAYQRLKITHPQSR